MEAAGKRHFQKWDMTMSSRKACCLAVASLMQAPRDWLSVEISILAIEQ